MPATLTYVVDQTRFSEVDGYGTLLLPDGTSHEVLRLKSTVSSEDSVYVDLAEQGFAFERETVTYLWLGDGGMPWMEVTTTLGIPSVVRYQGTVLAEEDTSSTDGLAALQSEMRLMPNPVHRGDVVTLGRDGQPVNWTLWNMQGACVLRGRSADLNTEELDAGVYLVRDERHGAARRLVVQ